MDELKINENVSPTDVEIIKDYWELTADGSLARKPTKFAQKVGISLYNLHKLVRENSEFIIEIGYCKECSTPLKETVTSHTAFNAAKITKERECEKCAEITEQKRMEERKLRQERDRERTLELARIRDAQEENLKAEIKENDTDDLSTVSSASRMTFSSKMNSSIKKSNDSIPVEKKNSSSILRFSLAKTDKRINSNQPHYGGTFTLKQDIVLKADVQYIYGGWINNDNSISLIFQPNSEYIKRPEQTSFDVESKETQDQIIKLRINDFDDTY